jgi:hypothetical protein
MAVSSVYQLPLFSVEKRCTKCGVVKPLEAFAKRKSGPLGRKSHCRLCIRLHDETNAEAIRAYRRGYTLKHAEENRARVRAWHETHPERSQHAQRVHYQQNKARIQEQHRAYHEAHGSEAKDRHRSYYLAHREKAAEQVRRYRQEHQQAYRARRHAWYLAHRAEHLAQSRAWKQTHPERRRELARWHTRQRKARLRATGGYFTRHDIALLYKGQDGCCAYCHCLLGAAYEIEHKVPVSRGGSSWPDNLALACGPCNRRKGRMTAEEFIQMLEACSV